MTLGVGRWALGIYERFRFSAFPSPPYPHVNRGGAEAIIVDIVTRAPDFRFGLATPACAAACNFVRVVGGVNIVCVLGHRRVGDAERVPPLNTTSQNWNRRAVQLRIAPRGGRKHSIFNAPRSCVG